MFCRIALSGAGFSRNLSGVFCSNCFIALIKMTINPDDVFHEPGNQLVLTCEIYTTVQMLCC